ncbi:GNAT family N-acetyltransferase [Myxococcus sp. K15C18031901]|uniref:GNAT family N-acetyltransferase n=1 Tax=Myxococcus dinghuensis TaxID=2906761 RepID=UPI0020A7AEE3|nr:GNAT family N-acetyltransferase [Myxococcus dinghuensis]MCP3100313.1 GNAT family N-acetyltransferase [Myxococcus dinghuensis]
MNDRGDTRSSPYEVHGEDGILISDDVSRIDVDVVHGFLSRAYWSAGIPRDLVEKAMRNSLAFGVYARDGAQVAYARVITDRATFAYLCDVYVDDAWQGKGLGKQLMTAIMAHPDLQGLRRFNLVTLDAHGLYAQYGFTPPRFPERYMEKTDPDIYKRKA